MSAESREGYTFGFLSGWRVLTMFTRSNWMQPESTNKKSRDAPSRLPVSFSLLRLARLIGMCSIGRYDSTRTRSTMYRLIDGVSTSKNGSLISLSSINSGGSLTVFGRIVVAISGYSVVSESDSESIAEQAMSETVASRLSTVIWLYACRFLPSFFP